MFRIYLTISIFLIFALMGTGCNFYDGYYYDNGGYSYNHVHSSNCGHHYWHGAWYSYRHPINCYRCAPERTVAKIVPRAEREPETVRVPRAEREAETVPETESEPEPIHVHNSDCGHYYWHGTWHSDSHPSNCSICYPSGISIVTTHVHNSGCGHYYWHSNWYSYPHSSNCSLCYGYYYSGGVWYPYRSYTYPRRTTNYRTTYPRRTTNYRTTYPRRTTNYRTTYPRRTTNYNHRSSGTHRSGGTYRSGGSYRHPLTRR